MAEMSEHLGNLKQTPRHMGGMRRAFRTFDIKSRRKSRNTNSNRKKVNGLQQAGKHRCTAEGKQQQFMHNSSA